ncbi:MAG TPA: hypothetical protein VE891_14420 [Allosphingosinicella sp.]|nr:hypothetical protein [Allosphingosinicella sp.]
MLTIFVAAFLAAPTKAEIDQLDRSMEAYQTCLITTARTLQARDSKLNPERAVAAAAPACDPQASKMVAIAKAQYSQRDSNGNVLRSVPIDSILADLKSAAIMRYRASSYIWDSRSQVWSTAK